MGVSPMGRTAVPAVPPAVSTGGTLAAASKMPVPPPTLLIAGFLAIIAAVPLGQLALELSRRERVQAVDLVRYAPTERNLRAYERTLEDKSWFRQFVRPPLQRAMLTALGDAGPSGLLGLLLAALAVMETQSFNPFLYFQF